MKRIGLYLAFVWLLGTETAVALPEYAGDVVAELPAPGGFIAGMAWDGEALWCVDRETRRILRVDPDTGDVLGAIPCPGGKPSGLDWADGKLWHADPKAQRMYRIDPASGRVDVSAPLRGEGPHGIALHAGCILIGHWGDETRVHVYDGTAGEFREAIEGPMQTIADFSHDERYLWVVNPRGVNAVAVDLERWDIAAILPLPVKPTAIAAAGDCVWVADRDAARLCCVAVEAEHPWCVSDWGDHRQVIAMAHTNIGEVPWQRAVRTLTLPLQTPNQDFDPEQMSWDPEPSEVFQDEVGRWRASFIMRDVPPGETVSITGVIPVRQATIRYVVLPHTVGTVDEMPEDVMRMWCGPAPAEFSMDDPAVQAAAREAAGDERNAFWLMVRIHDYVIDQLTYGTPKWHPVVEALRTGSGVCSDYANVMVALCRLNGLPARRTTGEVHASVEIWLPGPDLWYPINMVGDDPERPAPTIFPRRRQMGVQGRVIEWMGPSAEDGGYPKLTFEPEDAQFWARLKRMTFAADANAGPVCPGPAEQPVVRNGELHLRLYPAFDLEGDLPITYRGYLLRHKWDVPEGEPDFVFQGEEGKVPLVDDEDAEQLRVTVIPVDALGSEGPATDHVLVRVEKR